MPAGGTGRRQHTGRCVNCCPAQALLCQGPPLDFAHVLNGQWRQRASQAPEQGGGVVPGMVRPPDVEGGSPSYRPASGWGAPAATLHSSHRRPLPSAQATRTPPSLTPSPSHLPSPGPPHSLPPTPSRCGSARGAGSQGTERVASDRAETQWWTAGQ